ncbi:hypothetical protein [Mucilaginibacter paludis]|uniref:Lipoprotein n=1 Tax=Mucilaginibacter paludis DSM 18603 TaxID=714943 RepID=H1Y6X4_9SPHI|nr:hypothetical protein [Mucilaginibacter paludis]EHQ28381.1 hypothetical protein Mucpa_4291 [Mucilaginibacter paludis DSM 18603]
MKKLVNILAVALVLAGCSQSSTRSGKSADAPQLNQEQLDSVARYNKYKSTLNVVFGKVTFGISPQEFKKLVGDKPVVVGNSSYSADPSFTTKTNELYMVDLESDLKTANYIETELNDDMDNITSVITAKYGPPTRDDGKIQFFNFKPGYYQFVRYWDLYTKTIAIGMEEAYTGSEYRVVCQIYNKKMKQEEKELEATKTESKTIADTSKF